MKRFFLAALALLAFGCVPSSDETDSGFLELSGQYVADLVVVDNKTDELVYDGPTRVNTYQSGGPATYWSGAIGTAREGDVLFDASWKIGNTTRISIKGIATKTEGTFDDKIESGLVNVSYHYEFTDIRRENAITSVNPPRFDFRRMWPEAEAFYLE